MTFRPFIHYFLLLVFTLSISRQGYAAEEDKGFRPSCQAFYLTANLAYNSINQIHMQRKLESLGYEGFLVPGYSLGIGYIIHNDNWINFSSFNYMAARVRIAPSTTRNVFKSFSYAIGYDLLPQNRWSFYPYLGYRLDHYKFQFEKGVDSSLNMGRYFSSSTDVKEIYNYRSYLDIGCAFSYQHYGSYTLRIGYVLPLSNSRWRTWSHRFDENPRFKNQFYLSLNIGIGFMEESGDQHIPGQVMTFITQEEAR